MRDRSTVRIPSEIEATRLKFEKWRRRRPGQERIPETLWSEAVELARRYAHAELRAEKNIRPGGFGLLMTQALVDELVYNETHNEVVFVKYL